ncbi:hypothetical protein LEP1GSC088_2806 [Leptospira interrogans str. L1207]|nr:hypothetical protein LEP1GSC088_2806 [Leptospira interrogans str. L1207]
MIQTFLSGKCTKFFLINGVYFFGFENNNLGVPKASLVEISKAIFYFYGGNRKVNIRSD